MKRVKHLYVFIVCLLACVAINAQEVTSTPKVDENDELKANKVSEGQIFYAGKFESAANLGLNFRFSYYEFGGGIQVAGPGNAWNVNLGGAYRYYFNKNIFVEGAGGLFYSHASYESRVATGTYTQKVGTIGYREFTQYETVKYSSSGIGLYITPRVGLTFGKGWGVYAGYQLDFLKFKFDHIGDRGYWKLGFIIPF